MSLELYTKHEKIGEGAFAKVYRGTENASGLEVAIKIVDLQEADESYEEILKECRVLQQMRHPNVIGYYGSFLPKDGLTLHIVCEYAGGQAVQDLINQAPLDSKEAAVVLRESTQGLLYLHNNQMMHRDIKASNIVLTVTGDVKLIDFGTVSEEPKRNSFIGTPFWMAPEVIGKEDEYDKSADIWSLGITAIEIVKGEAPHAHLHPMRVLFLIPKSDPPVLEGAFKNNIKNFVALCLKKNPAERATAQQLLKDKFLSKAKKPKILQKRIADYKVWKQTQSEVSSHSSEEAEERQIRILNEAPNVEWDF